MASDTESPELALLPALEVRRLILSREVSPREAAAACLRRIRAIDDRIRLLRHHRRGHGDGDGRRRGTSPETGRVPAARRDPLRAQGPDRHGGPSYDVRFATARAQPARPRCRCGEAAARGRGRAPRQDEHARVRQPCDHGLRPLPGDAQPLGPRQDRGRLERRIGRSGRRLPLSDSRRLRWRGLDQDPVELLWRGRHQAVTRSHLEPSEREPARRADHPRADRADGERCRPHARRHGRLGARRPVRRTGPDPVLPRRERA